MTIFTAYRRLLRNGPLVRLLAGEVVSSIGDWLQLIALLVVVYRESNDPVLLGIVGAARVIPYVVLSVPARVVADRFDRRLVLLVTDVARGVIMIGLTWLVATDGPLVAIVGLGVAATCVSAFFGPTIGAYLPALVGDEEDFGPANSAWSRLDDLAFIVGPAVAGLLIATGGLTMAFALSAVSFTVIAVVLWQLPPSRGATDRSSTRADEAVEGATPGVAPAARVGRIRPFAGLALLELTASFVFGGLGILTVVLGAGELGSDEATGYLNAAIGAGGLVGALASGVLVLRPRLRPALLAGGLLLAAGVAGLGVVGSLGPALIAMAVASAGSLVVKVVATTILQRIIPDAVGGRGLGVVETAATLAYAGGALTAPLLAEIVGIETLLISFGGAVAVAAVVGVGLVAGGGDRPPDPLDPARERIARLPVFAGVAPARLDTAIRGLVPQHVMAGETVIRQGDPADRFFVIADGGFTAIDEAGGERVLREMGPDDVFGEIGLLAGAPRTATVRAMTDGLLFVLDGPAFLELAWAGPALASRLLNVNLGGRASRARRDATEVVSGS